MANVTLHPPRSGDVEYVARNMRPQDVAELRRMYGSVVDVRKVLQKSVEVSAQCWVAVDGGAPVCVFGVAQAHDGAPGVPWMLGTRLLDQHARAIVKLGRQFVGEWATQYPGLHNFVDVQNTRSIKWLQSMGFTVEKALPRTKFRRFHMGCA